MGVSKTASPMVTQEEPEDLEPSIPPSERRDPRVLQNQDTTRAVKDITDQLTNISNVE